MKATNQIHKSNGFQWLAQRARWSVLAGFWVLHSMGLNCPAADPEPPRIIREGIRGNNDTTVCPRHPHEIYSNATAKISARGVHYFICGGKGEDWGGYFSVPNPGKDGPLPRVEHDENYTPYFTFIEPRRVPQWQAPARWQAPPQSQITLQLESMPLAPRSATVDANSIGTDAFAGLNDWSSVEGEGDKTPASVEPSAVNHGPPDASGPVRDFYFGSGWQSSDVYHDIDKTSEAAFPKLGTNPLGNDVPRTSIWYSKFGGVYDHFGFSAGYIESAQSMLPRIESIQDVNAGLPLPPKRHYQEIDLSINYSDVLIQNTLEGTIGFNSFFATSRDFFGGTYAGELYGTLTLTNVPRVRPSVTYYQSFSSAQLLSGGFFEMKVEANGIRYGDGRPDFDLGAVNFSFCPYVSVGVDNGLIGDGTAFSALDLGLRVPVSFGKNWSLILNGNYGFPFHGLGQDFHSDLGEVGFWGGAAVVFKF